MIFLRTGLPGASKTLNSLKEIISSHDSARGYYYTNIKLFMLDIAVATSFSGWYYGWYFPRLTDKTMRKKLIKIMKPIHDEGEFITLDDVPWLTPQFESHDHFTTWLYWVERVYPKNKLTKLNNFLSACSDSDIDKFELIKPLNLHFTNFDDPKDWMSLPKRSVILIDECQQFFPPRAVGSRVPAAIAALETHRHGGYDIHFVTQDRTLCDANLRKLVGCHVHYFNALGGDRVTRKESPKCFDPNDYHDSKNSTKKMIKRDKSFYGVYWSAEIHTHKFKFPFMGFVAIGCVVLIGYSLYSLSSRFLSPPEPVAPPEQSQPVHNNNSDPEPLPSDPLEFYVTELLTDVYISGSVVEHYPNDKEYYYSFVRTSDNAVFYPDSVGLDIEPLTPCLANIRIGDVVHPITCNPFYIREIQESSDENLDDDGGSVLANNETAQKYAPDIKLF